MLPETLTPLSNHPHVEVILADGGGTDGTVDIAAALGAKVVHSPPGRARQMNAGAEIAKGSVFQFLHADTRPPASFVDDIDATLSHAVTAGGAFRLRIDAGGLQYRLVNAMANLRASSLQLPYGDQAMFVPAAARRLPIMVLASAGIPATVCRSGADSICSESRDRL